MTLVLNCAVVFADNRDRYPFDDPDKQQQFYQLLQELRCVVCQNQDLLDSNASLAEDLRNEIYQMIQTGRNKKEIVEFLTSRYGDVVLFLPPLNQSTLLLWFGPFILLVLSVVLLIYGIGRRNRLITKNRAPHGE